VELVVDTTTDNRCEGERILGGTGGTFGSNPTGRRYCAGQQCAWHIAATAADGAGAFIVRSLPYFFNY